MQTQALVAYLLVAVVSVVTPGPAGILAMRNGAAGGLRAVLPSSLGNVTGLFLLSAAAMLSLGVVLQSSALKIAAPPTWACAICWAAAAWPRWRCTSRPPLCPA